MMQIQTFVENKIWEIQNFFSTKECSEWIDFSEKLGYEEATVSLKSGAKMLKGIRNNERLIYTDEDLAEELWQRLKEFCPEYIENYQATGLNEQFRFYKYKANQRFKKHIDGSFEKNESEKSMITFLIYLNEDFEGGETAFENIAITPKTGNALCFLHKQKHEGKMIREGIKYVLRSDVMFRQMNL